MQSTNNRSTRVLSNTLMLFGRMLVLTFVNLFAVRFILQGLGDEGYGMYNTIAGVVTIAGFLNSILALSVQRFLSYANGEGDLHKQSAIYSASLNLTVCISVVIALVLETVGLWFAMNYLQIPNNLYDSTILLYHLSVATFVLSFLQVPFMATLFANEDMGAYSVISTVECLLRLVAAIVICRVVTDNLVLYGALLMGITAVILVAYASVTVTRYKDYRYTMRVEKDVYSKILSFSGWTSLGSIANSGLVQGSIILLNIFFGPIANVAFGIALQINNAFNSLTNSLVLPFRPVMIKAFAEKDYDYCRRMFSIQNKVIAYSLIAVSLPLVFEMETILTLWLGNATPMVILFSRLVILYVFFMALHNPITIMIHASGDIRNYHLITESMTLASLPLSWLLLHLGVPAYGIFISMIGVCVLAHVIRLMILFGKFDYFRPWEYVRDTVFLPAATFVVVTALSYVTILKMDMSLMRLACSLTGVPLVVLIFTFFIGFKSQERMTIVKLIKSKVGVRR